MKFTDQTGRTIVLNKFPERIISLVPSQTELLCDLGLDEKIVGITKFCVHPAGLKKRKPIIGGTKNLRMDVIEQLQPDLIIANKEENEKEQIEILAEKYPVWISDIKTLDDALNMITQIGAITNVKSQSEKIIDTIEKEKSEYIAQYNALKKTVLYLIWKEPYMSAGGDTFIHNIMEYAGYKNVTGYLKRYPELSLEKIIALKPEFIFLSSEPYPFKEKHIAELQLHVPQTKIMLVDGEMFSWYGSRLQYCWKYFTSLQQH